MAFNGTSSAGNNNVKLNAQPTDAPKQPSTDSTKAAIDATPAVQQDKTESPENEVKKSLAQQNRGFKTFTYPTELRSTGSDEFGPYMKISCYEYKRGFDDTAKEPATKYYNIIVPLPQVIAQEYSASLENFEGSAIFDAMTQISDNKLVGGVLGVAGMAVAGGVLNSLNQFLSGTGFDSIKNSLKEGRNLLSAQVGASKNPRYEVAFNSMNLRHHTFDFSFIAKSKEESETIDALVHELRRSSHPSTLAFTAGIFYTYPDKFVISFHDHNGNLLPSTPYIPDCVISGFHVATTTGRLHDNGSPMETKVQIAFQELTALNRDDIDRIHGKGVYEKSL